MCIGRIIVNSVGVVCASCHCHRRAALRCRKYDSVTMNLVVMDLLEPAYDCLRPVPDLLFLLLEYCALIPRPTMI